MTGQTPTNTPTDLTYTERRELGCFCTHANGEWHHRRFCPVPTVEHILAAREAHTNTLTDAEVSELSDLFEVNRFTALTGVVARIKADAYAAGLAARDAAPAPTDNQWCEDCGWVTPEHAAAHDDHHDDTPATPTA